MFKDWFPRQKIILKKKKKKSAPVIHEHTSVWFTPNWPIPKPTMTTQGRGRPESHQSRNPGQV